MGQHKRLRERRDSEQFDTGTPLWRIRQACLSATVDREAEAITMGIERIESDPRSPGYLDDVVPLYGAMVRRRNAALLAMMTGIPGLVGEAVRAPYHYLCEPDPSDRAKGEVEKAIKAALDYAQVE